MLKRKEKVIKMYSYETIILINPELTEEEIDKVVKKYKDKIRRGGEIEDTEIWGKRKLAYPINKKTEAYYVLYNFKSEPEFIDKLNKSYNIDERLMKHIIVRKD